MSWLRLSFIAVIAVSLVPWSEVTAQLPRPGGAAERDRGLLGRVGARREERLNRGAPPPGTTPYPPTPAGQAAAAQAAAARAAAAAGANPRSGLFGLGPLGPNAQQPLGQQAPTQQPLAKGQSPQGPAAQTNRSLAPNALGAQAGFNGNNPYRGPNTLGSNALGPNALGPNAIGPTPAPVPQGPARSAYYAPNSLSEPDSNTVPAGGLRPASLPPNRLPYAGPGVLIRLPVESRGEVNYLVDDSEHLIVHAGEDQLLRLKGSYEVRFSRGDSPDGKSFGEARYTVTEGIYRFEVTANGWELYREGEAGDVRAAIARAEQREASAQAAFASQPSPPGLDIDREIHGQPGAGVPPLLATPLAEPRSAPSSDAIKAKARPVPPPLPSPAQPAATPEDTLPAPKSILEQ